MIFRRINQLRTHQVRSSHIVSAIVQGDIVVA